MGTTLLGTQINNTYPGLLKTADNAVLGATEKIMGDGLGNDSTLSLGTASASFTGTLDLSGATVTGLPGGIPGLVPGTGVSVNGPIYKSMVSGSEVSNNPAVAIAGGDIVLGEGAFTTTTNGGWAARNVVIGALSYTSHAEGTAIGANTYAYEKGTAIGSVAKASGLNSFAGGRNAQSQAGYSVSIGSDSRAYGNESISIGYNSDANSSSISIGGSSDATGDASIAIGRSTRATQAGTVALGDDAEATADSAIAIGGKFFNKANASAADAIAIGRNSTANLVSAVALGEGVTVLWADATTVNQFAIANYANLNYADDTAAATGGVPLGGVYHNAGALRIRIA